MALITEVFLGMAELFTVTVQTKSLRVPAAFRNHTVFLHPLLGVPVLSPVNIKINNKHQGRCKQNCDKVLPVYHPTHSLTVINYSTKINVFPLFF